MKKILIGLAIVASIALNACEFNPNHISITTKDNENNLNFMAN